MDLSQAVAAIGAAVTGAVIALAGNVYATRASSRAAESGLVAQENANREAWHRDQRAAHSRWMRDQIDQRVGEVLVAVNRFSRSDEPGSFDGAWLEYANTNDRLARVAGTDVGREREKLWNLMFDLFNWRVEHRDLDAEPQLRGEWWGRFKPIWEQMGALNHAAAIAVDQSLPQ